MNTQDSSCFCPCLEARALLRSWEPIPACQHCWAGRQLQESSRLSGALSFKANIYLPRGILVLHSHSAR